jgi:hypothetical protein
MRASIKLFVPRLHHPRRPRRRGEGQGLARPSRAAKAANPVAANSSSITKGGKLWTKECASCHGSEGRGDGPQAKKLEARTPPLTTFIDQSDGELFWKVSTGRKAMPGYKKTLSDQLGGSDPTCTTCNRIASVVGESMRHVVQVESDPCGAQDLAKLDVVSCSS